MNNLLSYCWLVDARKSASEKDLPVLWEVDGQCYHSIFEDETKLKHLHTVVIKQLRPKFKFPAKIKVAFSQILAIRG